MPSDYEPTYGNSAQSLTETCNARGDDGPHRWGTSGKARTCSYCGMDRPTKASKAWYARRKVNPSKSERAAYKRLARMGIVTITPSADGDRVTVTKQQLVRLNPGGPCAIRCNPADRKYLEALRRAARSACDDARAVQADTRDTFAAKASAARAKLAAAKAQKQQEIDAARVERTTKRAAAGSRCRTSRAAARDARGHQPRKTTPKKKSERELAQLRDAEAEATLDHRELAAWYATGGGKAWKDEPRKSGLEAFRDFVETENLNDYAPDMPTNFGAEEAAWYARRGTG